MICHTEGALKGLVAHAAVALGEDIATQSEHTQRSLVAEILAHTGGVRADQVHLQLLHRLRGDDNVLEVAEAGVDTVLHNLVVHNVVNDLSAGLHVTGEAQTTYIHLRPGFLAQIKSVLSVTQLHQLQS